MINLMCLYSSGMSTLFVCQIHSKILSKGIAGCEAVAPDRWRYSLFPLEAMVDPSGQRKGALVMALFFILNIFLTICIIRYNITYNF